MTNKYSDFTIEHQLLNVYNQDQRIKNNIVDFTCLISNSSKKILFNDNVISVPPECSGSRMNE